MIPEKNCQEAIKVLDDIQYYIIHAKNQKRVRKLIEYFQLEMRRTVHLKEKGF